MSAATLVKNVIIVTAGKANYAGGGTLDQMIRDTLALGKQIIVVLGPDGDDLLRTCSMIEHCEMVFDPNFQGGFFSGVKAGLEAVNGASFVLPLGADCILEFSRWAELERALVGADIKNHVVRPVDPETNATFPLLITPQGLLPLKALPSSSDWLNSERIQINNHRL